MRTPEPWYRKQKKSWCAVVNGTRHTLLKGPNNAKTKKKALVVLEQILLTGGKKPRTNRTLEELGEVFLTWCQEHCEPGTYDWYSYLLNDWCEFRGKKKIADIGPDDVDFWFQKRAHKPTESGKKRKKFGPTTENRATGAMVRVFNWAVKRKMLDDNPLKGMERKPIQRRTRILTPEERELIFKDVRGQGFRDILVALEESGARPGEIARITPEHIDFTRGTIKLVKHKTAKKTKKPRTIFLTEKLKAVCLRLVKDAPPDQPIFRTSHNKPWSKDSLNCRFRRLRKKYPQLKGVTAYCFRHTFTTDALERGVPIEALRVLLGHESTRLIETTYGHLDQKEKYLKEMASKARGEEKVE